MPATKHQELLVLSASKAGAPEHPSWLHNIRRDPVVDRRAGDRQIPVVVLEPR